MNRKQSSSFCPDASKAPRNPQLDSVFLQRSCWKLQQDRNRNPVTCSQVWIGDNQSQKSCGKLQQGNVCDSSGSCGKLQQSIGIQLEKNRLDDQTLQVTDFGYVEKVFRRMMRCLT